MAVARAAATGAAAMGAGARQWKPLEPPPQSFAQRHRQHMQVLHQKSMPPVRRIKELFPLSRRQQAAVQLVPWAWQIKTGHIFECGSQARAARRTILSGGSHLLCPRCSPPLHHRPHPERRQSERCQRAVSFDQSRTNYSTLVVAKWHRAPLSGRWARIHPLYQLHTRTVQHRRRWSSRRFVPPPTACRMQTHKRCTRLFALDVQHL